MKKTIALTFLSAGSFFVSSEALAQSFGYANDALRYSRLHSGGTARISGIGGAQGALGGDVSSAHSNPAGLGFYNRSEISITPGFYNNNNESSYLNNNNAYDYKTNIGINNLGIAFNNTRNSTDDSWRGGTFALTYQRTQNLHNKFTFEGNNEVSAYTDVFPVFDVVGTENQLYNSGDPVLNAAIDAELVGIFEDPNEPGTYFYDTFFPYNFYSTFPRETYPVFQRGVIETEGRSSQLSLAYGANLEDKYYIGASIGLTSIDQKKTIRYQESADQNLYRDYPENEDFYFSDAYTFETNTRDTGNGLNATLGFIARPIQAITLGVSYRTPTLYSITNEENYTFTTAFRGGESGTGTTTNIYEYNLKTPGSLTLSGAVFAEKMGFISADVEFTNYSNARLTDDFSSLNMDNDAIRKDYKAAVNLRVGGELRYNILRLRAGYGFEGNPYRERLGFAELEGSIHAFSAGAGVRFANYFVDFALTQRRGTNYYSPYSVEDDTPVATMKNQATSALLTLGYTF